MTSPILADRPIYSDFGDDPDMSELVEMFVAEIPNRIDSLLQFQNDSDWQGVAQVAHQLKGAAGSYGFDEVTPFAAQLEELARDGKRDAEINAAFDQLVGICRRLKEGAPS